MVHEANKLYSIHVLALDLFGITAKIDINQSTEIMPES